MDLQAYRFGSSSVWAHDHVVIELSMSGMELIWVFNSWELISNLTWSDNGTEGSSFNHIKCVSKK